MKNILSIAILASVLAACGPAPVPQEVVDENMVVTRLNAQKNANSFLPIAYPEGMVDTKFKEAPMRVLMQSDSTVSTTCRYGDGWASGAIQFPSGGIIKVKCQTNGTGKGINGCMSEAEFQTKTYKGEDGHCQDFKSLEKFK